MKTPKGQSTYWGRDTRHGTKDGLATPAIGELLDAYP